MKICCIADMHGDYQKVKIPESDILICAGDATLGTGYEQELTVFINWFKIQPAEYKILIAGNHDLCMWNYNQLVQIETQKNNIIYLNNEECVIKGIHFWGSPITPRFQNWYFMADRGEQIKKYWNLIPDNIDVLITHGPPYSILDYAIFDKKNVGCEELLKKVNEINPKYHIFGHIHGCYGKVIAGKPTNFINCSVMNEDYKITNQPIIIEI
jgi:Icc-related predicted phosphoesterase